MQEGPSHSQWRIRGLGADAPDPAFREKLALFGRFVGDWTGEAVFVQPDGREVPGGKGEVHFNWILGGRAIQDVWMYEDPKSRRMVPAGTTVRFYHPEEDAWRSVWVSPMQGAVLAFTGREVDDEIVLETDAGGGRWERWIFFEIRPDSFRWREEVSRDDGRTWSIQQRYHLERERPRLL